MKCILSFDLQLQDAWALRIVVDDYGRRLKFGQRRL